MSKVMSDETIGKLIKRRLNENSEENKNRNNIIKGVGSEILVEIANSTLELYVTGATENEAAVKKGDMSETVRTKADQIRLEIAEAAKELVVGAITPKK